MVGSTGHLRAAIAILVLTVKVAESHTFPVGVADGGSGAGAAPGVGEGHAGGVPRVLAGHTQGGGPVGVVGGLLNVALRILPLLCPPHVVCQHGRRPISWAALPVVLPLHM